MKLVLVQKRQPVYTILHGEYRKSFRMKADARFSLERIYIPQENHISTHLLVFPELCFDGNRNLVILQFPSIQQLLKEVSLSGLLPNQIFRHRWRVWNSSLNESKMLRDLKRTFY